jgi:hypothetical protein
MNATGLPARIAYATVALALSGRATFYSCMQLLPQYAANHPELDPGIDGYGIFQVAISISAAVALTLSLLLLTLPGVRHRKRRGRGGRMALAAVLVVGASVLFADQGFSFRYDLLFAVWLAYLMGFTVVRYGITDDVRRASSSKNMY